MKTTVIMRFFKIYRNGFNIERDKEEGNLSNKDQNE